MTLGELLVKLGVDEAAWSQFRETLLSAQQDIRQFAAGVQSLGTAFDQALATPAGAASTAIAQVSSGLNSGAAAGAGYEQVLQSIAASSATAASALTMITVQLDQQSERAAHDKEELEGLKGTLEQVAAFGEALAVTEGIVKLGEAALEAAGHIEQVQVSMALMYGSTAQATEQLDKLKSFAQGSPFAFPDLANSARTLTAIGVEAEDLIPIMTAIGNSAAATGKDFDSVASAMARVAQTGQITGRQLVAFGVTWDDLAETMGVSVEKTKEALKKGTLGIADDLDILQQTIKTKFGNAMEAETNTLKGQLNVLKNEWLSTLEEMGNALTPFARQVIDQLKQIPPAIDELIAGFQALSPTMKEFVVITGGIVLAIGPAIAAITGLSLAILAIGAAAPVMAPIAAMIAGIGAAIALLEFSGVTDAAMDFFRAMSANWSSLKISIIEASDAVKVFSGNMVEATKPFTQVITTIIPELKPLASIFEQASQQSITLKGTIDLLMPTLSQTAYILQGLSNAVQYLGGNYTSMAGETTKALAKMNAANDDYMRSQAAMVTQSTAATSGLSYAAKLAAADAAKAAEEASKAAAKFSASWIQSADALVAKVPATFGEFFQAVQDGSEKPTATLDALKKKFDDAATHWSQMSATAKNEAEQIGAAIDKMQGFVNAFHLDEFLAKFETLDLKDSTLWAHAGLGIDDYVAKLRGLVAANQAAVDAIVSNKDGLTYLTEIAANQTKLDDFSSKWELTMSKAVSAYSKAAATIAETPILPNIGSSLFDQLINQINPAVQAITKSLNDVNQAASALPAVIQLNTEQFERLATEAEAIKKAMVDATDPETLNAMNAQLVDVANRMDAFGQKIAAAKVQLAALPAIAKDLGDQLNTAANSPQAGIAALIAQQLRLNAAMKDLGIVSDAVMSQKVRQDQADLDVLIAQGGTYSDITRAMDTVYKDEIALAKARGEDTFAIQAQYEAILAGQGRLADGTLALTKLETDLSKAFDQGFTTLETGFADSLVAGNGFISSMESGLQSIEKKIAEIAVQYLGQQFLAALKNGQDATTALMSAFEDLGKAVTNVVKSITGGFGAGSSFSRSVGSSGNADGEDAATADMLDGGFSSGGSAAGSTSGASGLIGSLGGAVSLIGTIAQALSDIVQGFQMAHLISTAGKIEENTRRIDIIFEQGDGIHWGVKQTALATQLLVDFNNTYWSTYFPAVISNLEQILSAIQSGGGTGDGSGGSSAADAAIIQALQALGGTGTPSGPVTGVPAYSYSGAVGAVPVGDVSGASDTTASNVVSQVTNGLQNAAVVSGKVVQLSQDVVTATAAVQSVALTAVYSAAQYAQAADMITNAAAYVQQAGTQMAITTAEVAKATTAIVAPVSGSARSAGVTDYGTYVYNLPASPTAPQLTAPASSTNSAAALRPATAVQFSFVGNTIMSSADLDAFAETVVSKAVTRLRGIAGLG